MGLILDTSILIAGERRREGVAGLLRLVRDSCGDGEVGISVISVVELTHGIYRARTEADRERRRLYVEGIFRSIAVYPLTLPIARLAGRIEGEGAANGITYAFEDLVIGATARHFGFGVVTLNIRHFEAIPGLRTFAL